MYIHVGSRVHVPIQAIAHPVGNGGTCCCTGYGRLAAAHMIIMMSIVLQLGISIIYLVVVE